MIFSIFHQNTELNPWIHVPSCALTFQLVHYVVTYVSNCSHTIQVPNAFQTPGRHGMLNKLFGCVCTVWIMVWIVRTWCGFCVLGGFPKTLVHEYAPNCLIHWERHGLTSQLFRNSSLRSVKLLLSESFFCFIFWAGRSSWETLWTPLLWVALFACFAVAWGCLLQCFQGLALTCSQQSLPAYSVVAGCCSQLYRLEWVFHANNTVCLVVLLQLNLCWQLAHRPLFGCSTFGDEYSTPFWHRVVFLHGRN